MTCLLFQVETLRPSADTDVLLVFPSLAFMWWQSDGIGTGEGGEADVPNHVCQRGVRH